MPIQLFQIFLDKQNEAYLAGEQVTGKFVIIVTDSYGHNGIYLKFEGHAIIKWTEDSNCFEQQQAKQHRARKQFFDTIFKYASEETLSEGTHIFPFEYVLPINLPSSLSTPTITIWYKMEALIQKDPKPRREVLVFPVQGVLDLNSVGGGNVGLKLNKSLSEVKSRSMMAFYPPCLCSFNYTSIGVRVAQQGFLPGDEVIVNLAVQTDCQFTFVSLSLVQEITVMTKEKTMIERRTTVKRSLPDLTPEDDSDDYRRWNENLVIPPDSVVSSNAAEYSDIKINYFIKFSAEAVKFPYKVIRIQVPITIGSVALLEVIKDGDGDSIIPDGGSDMGPGGLKDDHEQELENCKSDSETLQHHQPISLEDGDKVLGSCPGTTATGESFGGSGAVASAPPKIVVDFEFEDAETISSSTGMPSLDSNFLNSLENSMIKVVPVQVNTKIVALPVVAASTPNSASASPQKGVLRRVSIADSTNAGNSNSSSPAKRLAFQENTSTSPRKSSPIMTATATTSQPKSPSTPSPPSFSFSTSF